MVYKYRPLTRAARRACIARAARRAAQVARTTAPEGMDDDAPRIPVPTDKPLGVRGQGAPPRVGPAELFGHDTDRARVDRGLECFGWRRGCFRTCFEPC